jgi:hypothetical protein
MRSDFGALGRDREAPVRRIAHALDKMDRSGRYMAAFANMLGRLADSDQHISEEELHIMECVAGFGPGLARRRSRQSRNAD